MVPVLLTGGCVKEKPRISWYERPWAEMIKSFNSTELMGDVIFEINKPCWVLSILNPVFPNKKAELIKIRTARIGIAKKMLRKRFRMAVTFLGPKFSIQITSCS